MNNFNPHWMFSPPNLFGMGMPNRNCNQNAARTSPDYMHKMNNAVSNNSTNTSTAEPEKYESSGQHETEMTGSGGMSEPPGAFCGCGEPGPQGCPGERGYPPQKRPRRETGTKGWHGEGV